MADSFYCYGKEGFCEEHTASDCAHCMYTDESGGDYIDKSRVENNPYWANISKMAERQRIKGLIQYAQGIEDNPAVFLERIKLLQEELVDGLMYCEWIKDKIKEWEKR